MFWAGVFTLIAMTGLDQDMMQRDLSCASPRDSQKNIVLTALSQMVVIYLFQMLGVFLYLYMDANALSMPEKSDQVFSLVAVGGGLPAAVGILFVVGLISSTYSAAGSALTALTTSFTVDILEGTRRYDERRLTRVRRRVHVGMAVLMGLLILCFEAFGNDSVINLVYKVASYTYGPILGMFAFGMFTRCRVRDRWVPFAAVAAPLLSASLQYAARVWWSYHIGFELLFTTPCSPCWACCCWFVKNDEKQTPYPLPRCCCRSSRLRPKASRPKSGRRFRRCSPASSTARWRAARRTSHRSSTQATA